MLVLVPISVQQPPKMEAYETGIRIFEEDTPNDFESAITTGKSTTTTGVLLIKAEIIATKQSNIIKISVSQFAKFLQDIAIRFPIPCIYLKLY